MAVSVSGSGIERALPGSVAVASGEERGQIDSSDQQACSELRHRVLTFTRLDNLGIDSSRCRDRALSRSQEGIKGSTCDTETQTRY